MVWRDFRGLLVEEVGLAMRRRSDVFSIGGWRKLSKEGWIAAPAWLALGFCMMYGSHGRRVESDAAVTRSRREDLMADIAAVLKDLEHERGRLDRAIRILRSVAGGRDGLRSFGRRARRQLSVAGRRRIVAAQRARWAKARRGNSAKARPGRRVMSIAARRKIAAAQPARWAKWKAQHQKKAA